MMNKYRRVLDAEMVCWCHTQLRVYEQLWSVGDNKLARLKEYGAER